MHVLPGPVASRSGIACAMAQLAVYKAIVLVFARQLSDSSESESCREAIQLWAAFYLISTHMPCLLCCHLAQLV